MGINSESDIAANLQIGPTDRGMVRIYVEATGVDLPLDFEPEEAEEIAEELLAAAEAARELAGSGPRAPAARDAGKGPAKGAGRPAPGKGKPVTRPPR